jgi:hypothetical protein
MPLYSSQGWTLRPETSLASDVQRLVYPLGQAEFAPLAVVAAAQPVRCSFEVRRGRKLRSISFGLYCVGRHGASFPRGVSGGLCKAIDLTILRSPSWPPRSPCDAPSRCAWRARGTKETV